VDGFDATPVELQVCGSMLAQISGELRAELDVLQGEMDGLLVGGWQGQAATGFGQGWERLQAGANDVLGALRDMAQLLRTSGQNYQSADDSSTGAVRDRIVRFDQHLESALEDADARVNRLHASWKGEAATRHGQAHEEWKRGAAEMRAALAVMRQNALTAHENYLNAVTANVRMWEQVR
jgi:WXG100 family type VII secretion target